MAVLESAIFWIIVAAASEIIALSPAKDNSIVQLVLHALNSIAGKEVSEEGVVPDDAKYLFWWSTRSKEEEVMRLLFGRKSSTRHFLTSSMWLKKSGTKLNHRNKLKSSGKQQKQVPSAKTVGLYQQAINRLFQMIEPFIPALVAVATKLRYCFTANSRVTQLDHRVDKLELKLVESFTTKADFQVAMGRMEEHMIRIEDKLDKLVDKKCTT